MVASSLTSAVCGCLCFYSVVDCDTGHFWQVYQYPDWVCMGPFFLYLCIGNLVLWWCSRLIWVAWGSQILVYVSCCSFWAFIFFGQLAHSTWSEFVQVNTANTDGPGHKIFIFQKKPKMSLCSILAVSRGYLAKLLVPPQHCTTHPCCGFLVWNSSVNQIWPRPHWIVVCSILRISPYSI